MQEIHFVDTGLPGSVNGLAVLHDRRHHRTRRLLLGSSGRNRITVSWSKRPATPSNSASLSWKSISLDIPLPPDVPGGDILSLSSSSPIPHLSTCPSSSSLDPTNFEDPQNSSTSTNSSSPESPSASSVALLISSQCTPASWLCVVTLGDFPEDSDEPDDVRISDVKILPLSYVPSCMIRVDSRRLQGWLVCGSDGSTHAYHHVANLSLEELQLGPLFPELSPGRTTRTGMTISAAFARVESKRLFAMGSSSGTLTLTMADEFSDTFETESLSLDGPLSSLAFFPPVCPLPSASAIHRQAMEVMSRATAYAAKNSTCQQLWSAGPGQSKGHQQLSLVCGGALGFVVHFSDVLERKLGRMSVVVGPDSCDTVTCVIPVDCCLTGVPDLAVSTHGNTLMLFRHCGSGGVGGSAASGLVVPCSGGVGSLCLGAPASEYELRWVRRFSCPLFSLRSCDLTGDGLNELAVLSFRGCHVFQAELGPISDRVSRELDALVELSSLESSTKVISSSPSHQ